jgi:hypothetical protein
MPFQHLLSFEGTRVNIAQCVQRWEVRQWNDSQQGKKFHSVYIGSVAQPATYSMGMECDFLVAKRQWQERTTHVNLVTTYVHPVTKSGMLELYVLSPLRMYDNSMWIN